MQSLVTFNYIVSIFSAVMLFTPFSGQCQHFWNTDFEYETTHRQPRKWVIEGEGTHYEAKLNKKVFKKGHSSLQATLQSASAYIYLPIAGKLVAGRKLSVSVFVKTNLTDSLKFGFVLLNTASGKRQMVPPTHLKASTWQQVNYDLDVPANYTDNQLLLAFLLNGTGTVWLDEVKIQINGQAFGDDAPQFSEPTADEIKQLNQQLIPLNSLTSTSSNQDLRPLRQMIGSARVVALGENSHGSSTIFQMKLRLIRDLVQHQNFRLFVLECPAVEAEKVNDYVLHGKGSLKKVMPYLVYKSWQTKEMVAIIAWLRTYNQTHTKKVIFKGIDMQYGRESLRYLKNFVKEYPTLKKPLTTIETLYFQKNKNAADWNLLKSKGDHVKQIIQKEARLGKLTADQHFHLGYFWNIFLQNLQLQTSENRNVTRDQFLAENAESLMNYFKAHKMIVSADNDHIRKGSGKAGHLLYKKYAQQYKAIGFTFNSGTYQAYGSKPYYPVYLSYVGTYEYLFTKANPTNFYLNLNTVQKIPTLNKSAGFRAIGSRPQETTQFIEMNLKDNFDIIFYLEQSRHTKYLSKE